MQQAVSSSEKALREMYNEVLMILEQTSIERDELANTVIDLEAQLRSKCEESASITSSNFSDDIDADTTGDLGCGIEDDCTLTQKKSGIWFSTRSRDSSGTNRDNILDSWSIKRDNLNNTAEYIETSKSFFDVSMVCEVGTQTDQAADGGEEDRRFINRFISSEKIIIEDMTSDTAKLERLMDSITANVNKFGRNFHRTNGSGDGHSPVHEIRGENADLSKNLAQSKRSPTLINKIDLETLKARFVGSDSSRQLSWRKNGASDLTPRSMEENVLKSAVQVLTQILRALILS